MVEIPSRCARSSQVLRRAFISFIMVVAIFSTELVQFLKSESFLELLSDALKESYSNNTIYASASAFSPRIRQDTDSKICIGGTVVVHVNVYFACSVYNIIQWLSEG